MGVRPAETERMRRKGTMYPQLPRAAQSILDGQISQWQTVCAREYACKLRQEMMASGKIVPLDTRYQRAIMGKRILRIDHWGLQDAAAEIWETNSDQRLEFICATADPRVERRIRALMSEYQRKTHGGSE